MSTAITTEAEKLKQDYYKPCLAEDHKACRRLIILADTTTTLHALWDMYTDSNWQNELSAVTHAMHWDWVHVDYDRTNYDQDKRDVLHIEGVQRIMGMMQEAVPNLSSPEWDRRIAAHDADKLGSNHEHYQMFGIMWRYVGDMPAEFRSWLSGQFDCHLEQNDHHIQYWQKGTTSWWAWQNISDLAKLEMVCDWLWFNLMDRSSDGMNYLPERDKVIKKLNDDDFVGRIVENFKPHWDSKQTPNSVREEMTDVVRVLHKWAKKQ
ncbi:MAG: hypothetical protein HRU05_00420 [Oceanospirillaceae bacterium]|nr:hypothetical protein [Oceanospirillaceae bacterium]